MVLWFSNSREESESIAIEMYISIDTSYICYFAPLYKFILLS